MDENRSGYCDECKQKKERDKFRAAFASAVEQRLNPGKMYRFDEMLSVFYSVRAAEDLPRDSMSIHTSRLLSVYLQSKNTYEKEIREKEKKR